MPIAVAGQPDSNVNVIVTFARPDALKGSLKHTLNKVRPTIFLAVPRVWEKFREALIKISKSKPKGVAMTKFINFAKEKGMQQFNDSMAEATDDGSLTYVFSSRFHVHF